MKESSGSAQPGPGVKVFKVYGEEYEVDLRKIRQAVIDRMMDNLEIDAERVTDTEYMELVGKAIGTTRQTVWNFLSGGNSKLDTLRKMLKYAGLKWKEVARPIQPAENLETGG